MPDVDSIPGITDAEITTLRNASFTSTQDLWARLAEDKAGALDGLAAATGLSTDRLVTLLGADLMRHYSQVRGGLLRRHWLDYAAVAVVLLLAWAVFIWRPAIQEPRLERLRVQLKQMPADAARKTPYRANLVAAGRSAAEPVIEEVTGVEVQKDSVATLELEGDQLHKISRLLGTSDFYLAQHVP